MVTDDRRHVILSPHLDDAVLSCWHLLASAAQVRVLNVFAGIPDGLAKVAWWDQLGGASDSAERMRERYAEDAGALAIAGRSATALNLLDRQYRALEEPVGPVLERLQAATAPGELLYAPAALNGHPDHIAVRDAAIALTAAQRDCVLYADVPHAIVEGWPEWVTGRASPGGADPEGKWSIALGAFRAELARMTPAVHVLDPAECSKKIEAVRSYRTQFELLDEMAGGRLSGGHDLRFELTWARGRP